MRVRKDAKAELHAGFAVGVVSLLLVSLQQCADNQNGVYCHLVVLGTQILLGLDRQLSQCDGKAAAHIIILGGGQSASQGVVVFRGCSFLKNNEHEGITLTYAALAF